MKTWIIVIFAILSLAVLGCVEETIEDSTPTPDPTAEPRATLEPTVAPTLVSTPEPTATPTVEPTPTPTSVTIGNGSFEVGVDVQPGRYRSAGPKGVFPMCSFVRLKTAGASMLDFEQVIDIQNVGGPAIVNIAATDGGFFSQGCQTWELRE